MTDLLEFARFHFLSEWVALAFVVAIILMYNRVFRLNYINALASAQAIFVFNAIPVIAGFVDGYLGPDRVVHFFATEGLLMAAVCGTYAHIIRLGKEKVEEISAFFTRSVPYVMIAVSLALAVFIYAVTPQDGTSRILYQTNYWYSLIKPVIAIFTPVSYFAVFVLLLVHKRRLPAYGLLVVNILGNVASGSKGAFVMQAIFTFLVVRDLGLTSQFRLNRLELALAGAGLLGGLMLTLQRLRLTSEDLWDRVMLFGEPTLLVYFAPDPTAACRTLSLLAKMHRGWARILGDPGALDIDTLFGYAWTIQYVGVNTFTGTNARFSSYLICNFPDTQIVFGLLMTALYFGLIVLALRMSMRRNLLLPVTFAFVVWSISVVGQDFNLLMQDVNFLIGMVVLLLIVPNGGHKADRHRSPFPGMT